MSKQSSKKKKKKLKLMIVFLCEAREMFSSCDLHIWNEKEKEESNTT